MLFFIPQNKEDLLHAINHDYAKLSKDFEKVPLEKAMNKNMPGHTKDTVMSPYDLVAYLVGWADLVLHWNEQFERGVKIIFPCKGFKWTELGQLAQKFYTDYPDYDFDALKNLLDLRVKSIINLIERTDNRVLYKTTWYKDYTMGRMIQLNTSSPYKNARKRIRIWLKTKL